jgi:small subunit ribosomal protein S17
MARTITGLVTSDKADKTIVITVQTRKTHPLYKKQYTISTKFIAHDEKNEAHTGDKVIVVETRPISKRKRFMLQEIVETARITHVEPEIAAKKSVKKVVDPANEETK